jgi:predicted membrane-bound spermidine synthase
LEAARPPPPAKQFRLLGWDLANASLVLFLAAIVNKGSQFHIFVSRAGELDYLGAIFGGVAFLILYVRRPSSGMLS